MDGIEPSIAIYRLIGGLAKERPGASLSPNLDTRGLKFRTAKIGISLENIIYRVNNATALYFNGSSINSSPRTVVGLDTYNASQSVHSVVLMNSISCLQTVLQVRVVSLFRYSQLTRSKLASFGSQNLDATPEYGSLLDARLTDFVNADVYNATNLAQRANQTAFANIIYEVRGNHSEPTHWFYAAAVRTTTLMSQNYSRCTHISLYRVLH